MAWIFNPFTGTFDKSSGGSENNQDNLEKVISHKRNSAGFPLVVFCPELNVFLKSGPEIVFSRDGKIVRMR